MLAVLAPASRAAVRIDSISGSVSTGITGATITRTGTPARDNSRIIRSLTSGVGARGSSARASAASSVVMLMPISA